MRTKYTAGVAQPMPLAGIRKLHNLTQQDVAKSSGIQQGDVSKIEARETEMLISTLKRYVEEGLRGELSLVVTIGNERYEIAPPETEVEMVAKTLKDAREQAGLTHETLAARMGGHWTADRLEEIEYGDVELHKRFIQIWMNACES